MRHGWALVAVIGCMLAGFTAAQGAPAPDYIRVVTTPPPAQGQPVGPIDFTAPAPGPGFSSVTASPSDGGLKCDSPTMVGTDAKIHCTAAPGYGSGVGTSDAGFTVVTLRWRNPATKAEQTQEFVVDFGGNVGSAQTKTAQVGDDVWNLQGDDTIVTYTYGNGRQVAGPDLKYPKTIVARNAGKAILVIRSKDTNHFAVVVLTVRPKAGQTTAPGPAQPNKQDDHGGGGD